MEVIEAIKKRQSVRSFTDREVSLEDMKKIVEAGVLAPTGRNSQNLLVVGVRDKSLITDYELHLWRKRILWCDCSRFCV